MFKKSFFINKDWNLSLILIPILLSFFISLYVLLDVDKSTETLKFLYDAASLKLENIYELFEKPLIKILANMEIQGVKVDDKFLNIKWPIKKPILSKKPVLPIASGTLGVPIKNCPIPAEPKRPVACPPKAALPNSPPNFVPGIPKPTAPNIAALPIGLLITFFTPLTAFFTRLPSPYICLGCIDLFIIIMF